MACERLPLGLMASRRCTGLRMIFAVRLRSAQAAMPKPNHAPPREPVPKLSWASLVSTASKLA